MKKWKKILLVLTTMFLLIFLTMPAFAYETDITPDNVFDLEEVPWAEEHMSQLVRMGIVRGYEKEVLGEDEEYYYEYYLKPKQNITRAEFATMLNKALGLQESPVGSHFTDIGNHWAAGNINALREKGIINGYSDNTFMPEAKITRGEIVTMLVNALNNEEAVSKTTDFTDVKSKEDHWSYNFIQKAVDMGIVKGYQDGSFSPKGLATRAEVMAMLYQFLEKDLTSGVADEVLLNLATNYQKSIENIAKSTPDMEREEGPFNWDPAYAFITGSEVISLDELTTGVDMMTLLGATVTIEYLELQEGEVVRKSDRIALVKQYAKLHVKLGEIEDTYEGNILSYIINNNGEWQIYYNIEENPPSKDV